MTPEEKNLQAILASGSYILAEDDSALLKRPELRPVRLQLELLKPEMALAENGVRSTIVVFGSTRILEPSESERRLKIAKDAHAANPNRADFARAAQVAERLHAKVRYYDLARRFSKLVSSTCQIPGRCDYVVVTGGGPGIMEAANRGAFDVGAKSVGLNITLPHEQIPNSYVTPDLCFSFHYFALRKLHFLLRAKALVVFPGGIGTLDELTDALTLRQTGRMQPIPIILFGREYWEQVIDFQFLADERTIADNDINLIQYVETPEEAWQAIESFHSQHSSANP